MNGIGVKAVYSQGQWVGMFRKVHKADFETVCVNGEPAGFESFELAKLAAWDALTPHLQSIMVRDGDRLQGSKTEIERVFGKGTQ